MEIFTTCRELCRTLPTNPLLPEGKLDESIIPLPKVPGQPRIGPCVGSVGKFICIGLNYSDHVMKEAGMAVLLGTRGVYESDIWHSWSQ